VAAELPIPEVEVPMPIPLARRLGEIAARLRANEEGQTFAEYAVTLTVITLAILLSLAALGGGVSAVLQATIDLIPG
jgi:Flp pilus assembly pilin Flp